MSATTDTTPHNGTPHNKSTVIRTKRLSFKGRAVTHKSKSSPALLTEKTIAKPVPSCQTMIDLTVSKGEDLKKEIQQLMASMFPDWFDMDHNLKLQRLSGAMTNAVFFVDAGVKKVLLRVYGVGCDQILDRAKELEWLARLSQLHIGPKLLGTFGNGRFEEYLESRTLTYQDIRDPNYSTVIASRLAQLHSLVHTFPKRPQDKIEIWTMVDKWYGLLAGGLAAQLAEKSPKWAQQLKEWDLVKLGHDIEKCKNVLEKVNSPLVFAHNDAQYGNILEVKTGHQLVVIDFEYAGYNSRGYDIANHFCEWTYNYHSDNDAVMDMNMYPSVEEQTRFLTSYIHAAKSDMQVKDLMMEVALWRMGPHLFWGLWGLVQANMSEIDYDYFLYSSYRINNFRRDLENAINGTVELV